MTELPSKKIVACVVVRMKSRRLNHKALKSISGRPMTEQLIRRVRTARSVSEIVICTSTHKEDQILLKKADEWGVKSYAGHEQDVLSRLIEVSEIYDADSIIRVTGDNPFTDAQNIDRMVAHHVDNSADYTRTNRLPLGVTAEVMSKEMLKRLHSLMPDPTQSEYMSFFSFNPDIFHCEVLNAIPEQERPFYSLTVDYPDDLKLARTLYGSLMENDQPPALSSVIEQLDRDSNYLGMPKDAMIKLPGDNEMCYGDLVIMLDNLADKARKLKGERNNVHLL